MINHEGCPACSLLAEWPAVWFHGLDFPSREQQLRLTTLGRWGWRQNRKVVVQSIGGKATFYDFDLGRTLHHLYSNAGWAKKQEWNGPGIQHNREVKWRVQQRWWWLGFFWLKWLLQAASLIKLWILWSDQLNKLHLSAARLSTCATHRRYVSCSVSPVLGSESWHRRGTAFVCVFLD